MKKLFFLFAVVGVFALASCGAEQSDNPNDIEEADSTEQTAPQETDQPAEINETPADSTDAPKKTEETTTVNP
jgi:hypothetical protein